MREHDDAKIVLPGLQAYRGDVADVLLRQHLPKLFEPAAGKSW